MFVVNGDVKIPSTAYVPGSVSGGNFVGVTDTVEAYFVVSGTGTFYTTSYSIPSSQKFAPPTNKLVINGAVLTEGAQFNRNLGNSSNSVVPSEEFLYDPRHLVLLNTFLGERKKTVFECGIIDAPECASLNN